jgi:hypothetical protein
MTEQALQYHLLCLPVYPAARKRVPDLARARTAASNEASCTHNGQATAEELQPASIRIETERGYRLPAFHRSRSRAAVASAPTRPNLRVERNERTGRIQRSRLRRAEKSCHRLQHRPLNVPADCGVMALTRMLGTGFTVGPRV